MKQGFKTPRGAPEKVKKLELALQMIDEGKCETDFEITFHIRKQWSCQELSVHAHARLP